VFKCRGKGVELAGQVQHLGEKQYMILVATPQDHLGDLGIDGRVILKWILRN